MLKPIQRRNERNKNEYGEQMCEINLQMNMKRTGFFHSQGEGIVEPPLDQNVCMSIAKKYFALLPVICNLQTYEIAQKPWRLYNILNQVSFSKELPHLFFCLFLISL